MERFSKAFLRLGPGKWLCKEMVTLQSGDGRRLQVTPGVTYRRGRTLDGIDIALWLDDYHDKQASPAGWRSGPSAI